MKTSPLPSPVQAIRKQVSQRSSERFFTAPVCTSTAAIEQLPSAFAELKFMAPKAMYLPSGDHVLPLDRAALPVRVNNTLCFPPSTAAVTKCDSFVFSSSLMKAISLPSGENETGDAM